MGHPSFLFGAVMRSENNNIQIRHEVDMQRSTLVVLVLLAASSLAQANDVHKRTELGIAQVELSERLKSKFANTEQPANAMAPGDHASTPASEPKARKVRIVYPFSR